MPELPEVECARKLLEDHCVGSYIVSAMINEQGGGPRHDMFDEIVFAEGISPDTVLAALKSNRILLHAGRKGKCLWLKFNGAGKHIVMHLGMTGALSIEGVNSPKYRSSKKCLEWPPKFTKLELRLSNGVRLAFTDPRRLGRILFRDDPQLQPPISELAPDPLLGMPSYEAFFSKLQKFKAPLKSVLLDQQRLVCGIGNWVADEVCYQACIHPASICSSITLEQSSKIHDAIKKIIAFACEKNSDSSKYPPDWLFHYRWGKGNGKQVNDFHGNVITFETVGGRTSAIVHALMKRGNATIRKAQITEISSPEILSDTKQKTNRKARILTPNVQDRLMTNVSKDCEASELSHSKSDIKIKRKMTHIDGKSNVSELTRSKIHKRERKGGHETESSSKGTRRSKRISGKKN